MTLKIRFTLVALGVLIFVLITPALVLYARGFKYDFSKMQVVKTGTLVVKSEPRDATISLGDRQIKNKTPLNIRFLLPGDYEVIISKDGYQTWSKRLSIQPQFVTWANLDREFITLFRSQPLNSQNYLSKKTSVSVSADEIGFVDSNFNVNFISVDSGDLTTLPGGVGIAGPFDFNAKFAWNNGVQIYNLILDFITNKNQALQQLQTAQTIASNGQQVVFSFLDNLFALINGVSLPIDPKVSAFTLDNDEVWYIQSNQIKRFNLVTQEKTTLTTIPEYKSASLIRSRGQLYTILDQTLYKYNEKMEPIYSPVTFAAFDEVSDQLYFGNTNEILLFNPTTHQTQLILRSLTSLGHVVLNWETGYVFFANEGKIKTIELDGRDHRNVYTIADAGSDFVLDKRGKTLYVIRDDQIKIYEIR